MFKQGLVAALMMVLLASATTGTEFDTTSNISAAAARNVDSTKPGASAGAVTELKNPATQGSATQLLSTDAAVAPAVVDKAANAPGATAQTETRQQAKQKKVSRRKHRGTEVDGEPLGQIGGKRRVDPGFDFENSEQFGKSTAP
jgi:hypothetical protein